VVFLRRPPGALRICHFQKLSLPKFLKSAGCIIVIDEPLDVSDPVGSVLISIKSLEGLPERSEIDAHCCRSHAPSV